tara:strand:+ start:1399 stop:1512 length:114 start_codon:yes stop_codon:yes gene_type:complete
MNYNALQFALVFIENYKKKKATIKIVALILVFFLVSY